MDVGLARASSTADGSSQHLRRWSFWSIGTAIAGAAAVVALAGIVHGFGATKAVSVVVLIAAICLSGRVRADAAGALIILTLGLLLIPARLRVAPLHAAGTPGSLIGVAAFAVWTYGRVLGRPWLARGLQPLRGAMAVFAGTILASYVAMGFRPHTLAEAKAADRGLLTMMSMMGIALLVADGVTTRARLRRLLEALVIGGTAVGILGMVQFFTGQDLAARVHVPGFTYVASDYNALRSGFNRIVSTTTHPIEFSVTLVLTLCIALHLMFTSEGKQHRLWATCASLVAVTVPMTVSRTGVIALVAAAVVLFPSWSVSRRFNIGLVMVLGTGAMRLAIPGLIGTLQALLFDSSNDPSLTSRTAGYNYAIKLFAQHPWFGRGFGTFIPEQYTFLDDQALLSLVETGLIGVLGILVLFAVSSWLTREVRRLSDLDADRDLAQVLFACIAVGISTAFTYDALSFPTSRTVLMLAIGATGALWRIVQHDPAGPDRAFRPTTAGSARGV